MSQTKTTLSRFTVRHVDARRTLVIVTGIPGINGQDGEDGAPGGVTSVNGQTGVVNLESDDIPTNLDLVLLYQVSKL